MEQNSFSIRACASYGWRATFNNIGLSIGILLTMVGVHIALGFISDGVTRLIGPAMMMPPTGMPDFSNIMSTAFVVNSIVAVFAAFISSGMSLGFIRIALDLYDKGTSTIMRLFSCFRFVLKVWLASAVLMGIFFGVLVGIIVIDILLLIGPFFVMKLLSLNMPPAVVIAVVMITLVVALPFVMLKTSFFMHRIVDKNAGPLESVLYSFRATKGLFWKIFGLQILAGLSYVTIIGIPAGVYMSIAAYRKLPAQTS